MVEAPHDMPALRRLSEEIGRDPTLTQGPGGNTSVKEDGVVWVKASGTWMANAETHDIFLPLDATTVRRRLEAGKDDCAASAGIGQGTARASIEAAVHAVLPHRIVIHVHCVETIRWAVLENGHRDIGRLLDGLAWIWIRYWRPGAPLARAILECMPAHPVPDVYVFQNHGLVVAGASCAEAMALLGEVRKRLAVAPREIKVAAAVRRPPPSSGYRWTNNSNIARLAFDATARKIARAGTMYPDHIVFLGTAFPEACDGEDIDTALTRWRSIFGKCPLYLVVPGHGVLVADDMTPSAIATLEGFGHVTARIAPDAVASIRYLTADEIAALTNWDAEILRQRLARLGASP